MVRIIGAGMAGLLAGNMLIGRREPLSVVETQPELPNNHSAVLRFRSSVVGDAIGIDFKKVNLIKTTAPWRNPVADALAYSRKNLGVRRSDRSIASETATSERWIAPPDFVPMMAARLGARMFYGKAVTPSFFDGHPIISTIPMPDLMALLAYPEERRPNFNWLAGTNLKVFVARCDAYVSVIEPDPDRQFSRVSITGDELVIECPGVLAGDLNVPKTMDRALHLLGLEKQDCYGAEVVPARYAKILPVDEGARRDFLHWATENHNVFSLGRYATWRPGLLLDDLVKDVRLIDRWITSRDNYERALKK